MLDGVGVWMSVEKLKDETVGMYDFFFFFVIVDELCKKFFSLSASSSY